MQGAKKTGSMLFKTKRDSLFVSNKQASKQHNNKTQFMTSDEGVKTTNKL